jgi:hypothetical protein
MKSHKEDARVLRPSEEVRPAEAMDDDALIRWMLALPPIDRLAVAQGFVDSVIDLDRARAD